MKDDVYDACAWGSHLPALLACLADTVGPVLELGVGNFSTPALHAFCVAAERLLVSVEDNKAWFDQFSKFHHRSHAVIHDNYDQAMPGIVEKSWSVAFIDNSPGGKRRADDFQALIKRSIFVVVHDYHLENSQAIEPLLNGCNHHVTKTYQPPTLIASRTRSIPESILIL